MDFSFSPADATVEGAVRRIATERIDDALDVLAGRSEDDPVHTVRKRMKQLRALVRLVGPNLPQRKREDRDFRDTARALSGARDAAVMAATFDSLARSAARPLGVDLAYAVRKSLADAKDDAAGGDEAAARAEVVARLRAARERVAGWSLADDGWSAISAGLALTYARAKKEMKAALKGGDDEAVHAWRKDVKAHYHHLELLQPIWPAGIKPQIKAADRLQEALGEHHDAAVLSAHLAANAADFGGERAIGPIAGLVDARQAALAEEAHALGARLLAEDPDAFADRLRRYWKEWRRERRLAEADRLAA